MWPKFRQKSTQAEFFDVRLNRVSSKSCAGMDKKLQGALTRQNKTKHPMQEISWKVSN